MSSQTKFRIVQIGLQKQGDIFLKMSVLLMLMSYLREHLMHSKCKRKCIQLEPQKLHLRIVPLNYLHCSFPYQIVKLEILAKVISRLDTLQPISCFHYFAQQSGIAFHHQTIFSVLCVKLIPQLLSPCNKMSHCSLFVKTHLGLGNHYAVIYRISQTFWCITFYVIWMA